jgi:chromate transporter
MATSAPVDGRPHAPPAPVVSLRDLGLYFLRLGAFGFGGPIALAGYMQRDLQEARGWITREEHQDGLAIAQTMPGPLAAQLAMWIGFLRHGVRGATLVGLLFVLPPFVVVAVAAMYVAVEGLPQIRALFYGIGPAAIAIVVLAAWKLAKTTDGTDWRLWAVSAVLAAVTVVTRTELAWLFVVAGILAVAVFLAAFVVLSLKRFKEPYVVGLAGLAGLLLFRAA